MSDYAELKAAAEKAFNAAVEVEKFLKGSALQIEADNARIMAESVMRRFANPTTILSLLSENAKMRKALKPFADEAAQYDLNDDDRIRDDEEMTNVSDFSVGELRRARAAIGDAT